MKTDEESPQVSLPSAELELNLQEAHARRQRAAELFASPAWDERDDDSEE